MKNSLNIPSTFSLKKELQTLVGHLLNTLNPNLIYLSTIREDTTPVYSLHLILKSERNLSKEEVASLDELRNTFPQFIIQWSTLKELRIALAEGKLYFIRQCYFGDLIYSFSTNDMDPMPRTTFKGSSLIKKAQEKVAVEIDEMVDYFTIVNMFYEERELSKVLFKLTALLPRLVTSLLKLHTGKGQPDTTFSAQIDYLARLSPYFEKMLRSDKKNHSELISVFENLHTGRYQPTKGRISGIKTRELIRFIYAIFKGFDIISQEIISTCAGLEKSRNPDKKTVQAGENVQTSFEGTFQKVLQFLQSEYQVHSVFLLGKEQHIIMKDHSFRRYTNNQYDFFTCTVFLVTKEEIPLSPNELQQEILHQTGGKVKAFFILDILSRMSEIIIDGGSNFPQHFIKNEHSRFQADDEFDLALRTPPTYDPARWKEIHEVWELRFERAKCLLEVGCGGSMEEEDLVIISNIENAFIQTCLGMLHVFWEFKPAETSLPYLIHLCSHFSDFPKKILSSTSFESQQMLYLLTHGQQLMLCTDRPISITSDDVHIARDLCERFMEKAEQVVENQLYILKVKSFQG